MTHSILEAQPPQETVKRSQQAEAKQKRHKRWQMGAGTCKVVRSRVELVQLWDRRCIWDTR